MSQQWGRVIDREVERAKWREKERDGNRVKWREKGRNGNRVKWRDKGRIGNKRRDRKRLKDRERDILYQGN